MKPLHCLQAVLALSLVAVGLCDVELMCPPLLDLSGNEYTELTPGPRTIKFLSTGGSSGSPYRLSIYKGSTECVVLDHIPYQRDGRTYYVTVDIPDMSCSRVNHNCRMILYQMDVSTGYCDFNDINCTRYNSTVPISVRSAFDIGCNGRRKNFLVHNWPFDPTQEYMATLTGSSSTAAATGSFVLVGHTILFTLTITTPFSHQTPAERIRFLYSPGPGTSDGLVVLGVVDIDGTMATNRGSWSDVSDQAAELFKAGNLYVDVITTDRDNGEILGQILPSNINAAVDNLYGQEYGDYNSDGWLSGGKFVGSSADATLFTKPFGPCVTDTRYFGCMLETVGGVSSNGGGTVALALLGNRVVFGMDMYNTSSGILSVYLEGDAINAWDLSEYWSDGYRVNGVADIEGDMRRRLVNGLSSVRITTRNNRNGELSCQVQEGMMALLDALFEVPPAPVPSNGTGTAFAYFSVDGQVTIQITLNKLTSALNAAHVHGPAPQGLISSVRFDISSYIEGQVGDSWNIRTTLQNLTAEELRYFREGLYYLNMHTESNPSGELRGQVKIIGDWICPQDTFINQCYWVDLEVVNGLELDTGLTPYGVGGVVMDRTERLQYSLAFWNIPSGTTLTVSLRSPSGTLTSTSQLMQSDNRNVLELYVVYPLDYNANLTSEELSYINNGQLEFNVTTPQYASGYLYGKLPRLSRSSCNTDTKIIVVGGVGGWIRNTEYFPYRVVVGDLLYFKFNNTNDTVYLMANKNRYDGCVFQEDTATLLASGNNSLDFSYITSRIGDLYFASRASCQATPPMKVPVYVADTLSTSSSLDTDTCAMSLYSYTMNQRLSDANSSGAVAAAVVGLLVGVVLIVVLTVVVIIVALRRPATANDTKSREESKM